MKPAGILGRTTLFFRCARTAGNVHKDFYKPNHCPAAPQHSSCRQSLIRSLILTSRKQVLRLLILCHMPKPSLAHLYFYHVSSTLVSATGTSLPSISTARIQITASLPHDSPLPSQPSKVCVPVYSVLEPCMH